jgi:Fe-S cluster assembly ATPase SufC
MGFREFDSLLEERMKTVEIDPGLTRRSVNEGFSGGEKKRNEILQMLMLEPTLAILDGRLGADIDALRSSPMASISSWSRQRDRSCHHYQRLLNHRTTCMSWSMGASCVLEAPSSRCNSKKRGTTGSARRSAWRVVRDGT